MAARKKRLGFDTDVWALVAPPHGHIRGGDYRPHIYWTKAMAKAAVRNHYPECTVERVRIVRQEEPTR
jgi:hypothetical protein